MEEAGSVVINASRFHAVLRESHTDEVSILGPAEAGSVEILSGNSRFKLSTDAVDEFPQLEKQLLAMA